MNADFRTALTLNVKLSFQLAVNWLIVVIVTVAVPRLPFDTIAKVSVAARLLVRGAFSIALTRASESPYAATS